MTYSFCEPVHASTMSPEHIRRLVDDVRHLGGGIPEIQVALCGASLRHGWDLTSEVTEERVRIGQMAECNRTCRECARRWREETST